MRIHRTLFVTGTVFLLVQGSAFPQSLADIARQEEERRKTIKKPSKVYTDEHLRRDPNSPPPTPAGAPATPPVAGGPTAGSSSPPAAPKTGTPDATEGARDQTYWKNRMAEAREQLERSKTLLDAMQSRINALNADFVNVDDPAKRAVIARDRQKALAEMERLKKEIQGLTKSIADIEEEARRAKVPPGWLR